MMDVFELRIGNYIKDKEGNTIMVEAVLMGGVGATINSGVHSSDIEPLYPAEDLEPIELTPELLEKCGFKIKSMPLFDYHVKYFTQTDTKGCVQKSKFSLGRGGTEVFINDTWLCGIDYLHQLQNLFYAITNEELTITL